MRATSHYLPTLPAPPHFRHNWRPSRWQYAVQSGLGLLAAFAVLHSDLPLYVGTPLALGALAWGIRQAHRDYAKAPQQVLIPAQPKAARLDDQALDVIELLERGPLLLLRWQRQDRRTTRHHSGTLLFWPDTLSPVQRRALRLAVRNYGSTRQIMAP